MAEAAVTCRRDEIAEGVWTDPSRLGGTALAIPEFSSDELVRHRAARFIGQVAAGTWLDGRPTEKVEADDRPSTGSLHEAIQAAHDGDHIAREMVSMNVATDVSERTIKSGHIISVELQISSDGSIHQFGQTQEQMQANSLKYASDQPQMRQRTEAETRNSFRLQSSYAQGQLDQYNFLVFSRAADDMSAAEMRQAGFFTNTMSCAIQLTRATAAGLTMESAFVAGTVEPGGPRHDQVKISQLLAELNVEVGTMTATELLDTPFLVPKGLTFGGVIDLVKRYDQAHTDTVPVTFFGEDRPAEDYQRFKQRCVERQASFQPTVDEIVQELIREAPDISSKPMATDRLHQLSEKHMLARSITDVSIKPTVFGVVAAAHIEMARWHYQLGQYHQALHETSQAAATAQSSSCPNGKVAGKTAAVETADGTGGEVGKVNKESDDSGDCEFESKECPLCHEKNVKTTVKRRGGMKIIQGHGTTCKCTKVVKV